MAASELFRRTEQRHITALRAGKRAQHCFESARIDPVGFHDQPDHRIPDGFIYGKIAALWHWPAPCLSIRSPCSRTVFHLFTGRSRMKCNFSPAPIWPDQITVLLLTADAIGVTSK
ncbi:MULTISPECIES: hypothetical protein [unclassified Mesorhizobium]|uniref:hypothetical protein n=1 Tax=unclassified Mesorhizobium TaxID=325217 RepID=UPI0015E35D67|nr:MULTISPECIES: hypothetical protein [unclassified Mesorhizobium]MCA0027485.1 hypothetical protein [Mesorhizobium sp. B263B1A]